MNVRGSAGVGTLFFHLLPFVEQDELYRGSELRTEHPLQLYFDYQRINRHQVGLYNCPSDFTLPAEGGAPGATPYAASSYAANFLVFGRTSDDFQFVDGFGSPSLNGSFPDGTSSTILFGEKYAVSWMEGPNGQLLSGGCHWDYWGHPSLAPFFALYVPGVSDLNAVGPKGPGDAHDSRFETCPPARHTNGSLCSTAHPQGMNVAMADGSSRCLTPGISPSVWWALVTPAGQEVSD
jgi:prepilin-type processing-associated H-X9-DG protein